MCKQMSTKKKVTLAALGVVGIIFAAHTGAHAFTQWVINSLGDTAIFIEEAVFGMFSKGRMVLPA